MKNNCTIYIINLESSIDRKNFIKSQLDLYLNKDINYEFFRAINGKENPNFYLFNKYNEKKRFLRKGNMMSLSQLGCFASHYLLWEKCIELNTGIVILEDDSIIQENFVDVYNFISSSENRDLEFIWLSPPTFKKLQGDFVKNITNNTKILKVNIPYDNASGYYITPIAAKKLLKQCEEWIYEVDISMDRFWENNISFFGVSPACIKPDHLAPSNIHTDKNSKNRNILIKLRREIFKIIDTINKHVYLLLKR